MLTSVLLLSLQCSGSYQIAGEQFSVPATLELSDSDGSSSVHALHFHFSYGRGGFQAEKDFAGQAASDTFFTEDEQQRFTSVFKSTSTAQNVSLRSNVNLKALSALAAQAQAQIELDLSEGGQVFLNCRNKI